MIIARFEVLGRVPNTFEDVDRQTATVERYLYKPLEIVGTCYSTADDRLHVKIEGRYKTTLAEAQRLVTYQRDRFGSGLIPTTEPTFEEIS